MVEKKLLQVIDANLNRAREGLRVCEDIARFALRDKKATESLKKIRHSATGLVLDSKNTSLQKLVSQRNTSEDKTKFTDYAAQYDNGISDIFMANIERVKESLRVLEECFRIVDEKISLGYRRLRFNTYDIEKKLVKKAGLISCNR